MTKHIIFVGGDERQARAGRSLQAQPGSLADLDVEFYFPCWNPNWNKVLARIERRLDGTDIIVLSTDVPTLLGHALRDLARRRGISWWSARGRGQAAILQALRAAAKQAALSEPSTPSPR